MRTSKDNQVSVHFANNPLLSALQEGLPQIEQVPALGTVREDGRVLVKTLVCRERTLLLFWNLPGERSTANQHVLCASPEEIAQGERELAQVKELCMRVSAGWAAGQSMLFDLEALRQNSVYRFYVYDASCPCAGTDRRYDNRTIVREGTYSGCRFTWFPHTITSDRPYLKVDLEP